MAEGQGFEPWEGFHLRRFSRPVHSTALPSLRLTEANITSSGSQVKYLPHFRCELADQQGIEHLRLEPTDGILGLLKGSPR